jgi:hypothetical protein
MQTARYTLNPLSARKGILLFWLRYRIACLDAVLQPQALCLLKIL